MYGVVAGYMRAALIIYQFKIGGECMKRKGKEYFKLSGMLFAFCVFVLYNMIAVSGIHSFYQYIDIPTLVGMIFFTAAVLWLSGMGKDFLNGLRLAFSDRRDYSRIMLQRACNAVKYTRTLIFLEAVIMILIGIMEVLYHVDPAPDHFRAIGAALAVTLICVLYASMLAVLLAILSAKLDNMLASYMEEPQAEISVDAAQAIYFKMRAMGLTDREAEVARLVSCDMTNREIGQTLYISDTTVKKHITHILEKTALTDREELTKLIRDL